MLEISALNCFYGHAQVLRDLTFTAGKGEILCLLGRNGAGKTTTLKAIMGLMPAVSGRITLDGDVISQLPPHEVPRRGVGYVPQGRRLFAELTVKENLDVGLMTRKSGSEVLDRALTLFPLLQDRLNQRSGTMSGGEQQMLAMARALCLDPKLLLLDEPTEGLMPSMVQRIREAVLALKAQGVTTLLVEQRVEAVLPVADRVAFMERGRIAHVADVDALKHDPDLITRYVGVSV